MSQRDPIVLAVGGGKGGVGKSMISANLAVQYAQAGLHVVLMDMDFGAANLHTLFGIRQPSTGLGSYLTTPRSHLKDYQIETSVKGLNLIPCNGFIPELANLRYPLKLKLLKHIRQIEADVILLDLGAGSSYNVVDFFAMTDASVIVTTPEPTSIVNAYEFLKNVVYRVLNRMFRNHEKVLYRIRASTTPQHSMGLKCLNDVIESVREIDPWAAENIADVCEDLDFHIVFNQGREMEQAKLGSKLQATGRKFLNLDLHYAGMVFYNEEVPGSVLKMSPISLTHPDSITTQIIKRISLDVLTRVTQRLAHGDRPSTAPTDVQKLLLQAKQDFQANLLTQRRLLRQRDTDRADVGG